MVTPEQETRLQEMAKNRKISVARLLMESTLDADRDNTAELVQAVNGLRKMLSYGQINDADHMLQELLRR
jgi:hypothetical protein